MSNELDELNEEEALNIWKQSGEYIFDHFFKQQFKSQQHWLVTIQLENKSLMENLYILSLYKKQLDKDVRIG